MITIPTIKELYDDIRANIDAHLNISIPVVGKLFTRAFAATQAAKLKLYYLAIGFLQKNIFVDTADQEDKGGTLERWGRIKLGRNPNPAVAGTYTIQVTGTVGATIPAQSTFKSDDSSANPGKLFILDVAYTLTAATDTIDVRALESGLDSKLDVGDTLTATQPIIQVDSGAQVTVEVVQPLSAEDIELYRARTLESFRLEPQGGAGTDYRLWASDASGVQQSYPYATSGNVNEVDVFVEAVRADSADLKGTPGPLILAEVENVIEFDPDTSLPVEERGRRPLGLWAVNVLPVDVQDIDVTINGFVGLTPELQTAIDNSIALLIDAIRPFVSSVDIVADQNDVLTTNAIIGAILEAAPGSQFGAVTMTVGGTPATSYQFVGGEIPFPNSVAYV